MSKFKALDITLGVLILVALGTVLALAFVVPSGVPKSADGAQATAAPVAMQSSAATQAPVATDAPSAQAATDAPSAPAATEVPLATEAPSAAASSSPAPKATESPSAARQVALGQATEPGAQSIDDGLMGVGLDEFRYAGAWEHISNRGDGRTLGTSSRSFRKGDRASISFVGSRVRLYGINGPGGGLADITLDGHNAGAVADFYSPLFATQAMEYESPELGNGVHTLTISVSGKHDPKSRGNYVNIDRVVIVERHAGQ